MHYSSGDRNLVEKELLAILDDDGSTLGRPSLHLALRDGASSSGQDLCALVDASQVVVLVATGHYLGDEERRGELHRILDFLALPRALSKKVLVVAENDEDKEEAEILLANRARKCQFLSLSSAEFASQFQSAMKNIQRNRQKTNSTSDEDMWTYVEASDHHGSSTCSTTGGGMGGYGWNSSQDAPAKTHAYNPNGFLGENRRLQTPSATMGTKSNVTVNPLHRGIVSNTLGFHKSVTPNYLRKASATLSQRSDVGYRS